MTPQTLQRAYRETIHEPTEPTVFECSVRKLADEIGALGIAYHTVEVTMLGKGAMTLRFKRDEIPSDINTL